MATKKTRWTLRDAMAERGRRTWDEMTPDQRARYTLELRETFARAFACGALEMQRAVEATWDRITAEGAVVATAPVEDDSGLGPGTFEPPPGGTIGSLLPT